MATNPTIKPKRGTSAPGVGSISQNELAVNTSGKSIYIGAADGSGILVGSAPQGSNSQVQYNNSGSFAGSGNFTFDGSGINVNGIISSGLGISTSATTFNIVTNTASTINIGTTSGSTILIGNSAGTATINNAATNINGTLTVTGATTLQGTLAVNGNTVSSSQTTFNLLNTTITNANVLGAADTIVMGSANGTATIRNAGTNINGTLTVTGATTLQGAMSVSTTISSGSTTFNLLNTTVTNANVLGAANTIVIGGTGGNATVRNAATNLNGTLTVTGVSTLQGNVNMNGTLTVTGVSNFVGVLTANTITTTSFLAATNGGDEGGEILLGKAVTNTTLSGSGVTIDVYQNRLRFFEQGGAARGYYLDISNGGGGVSTQIGGSATAAGSNTQVQYNNSGAFAGSGNFTFDGSGINVNGIISSGLGISTSATTFNIATNTASTINIGTTSGSAINIGNTGGTTTIRNAGTSINGTLTVTGATVVQGALSTNSTLSVTGTSTLIGDVTAGGDIAVNGGDITSTATTFNLLNATVTNANVLGAANTIVIGGTGGTATIRNAGTNINGTLTVTGASTLQGNVNMNGTLTVTGATTLNNNLTVTGASTLQGNTNLNGTLTVTGVSVYQGAGSFNSTLTVTGATTLNNNLTVTGASTLQGNVNMNGTLTVTGATTLNNNLTVTGATTLQGNSNLNGNLTVTGATTLQGTMSVSTTISSGSTTFNLLNTTVTNANVLGAGDTIIIGSSTAGGSTTIRNAGTSINGTLTVTGATTLQGAATLQGNVSLNGNLTVTGATTLQSTLAVGGNTISSSQTTFNLLNTTVTNANVLGAADTVVLGSANAGSTSTIRSARTVLNGQLSVTGTTTIGGFLSVGSTVSSGSSTISLFNTTVTSANVLGAAQQISLGTVGNSSYINLKTNSLYLGDGVSSVSVYVQPIGGVGSGNNLTLAPTGSLIIAPIVGVGTGGSTPRFVMNNTDAASGSSTFSGGDLYLASKTDDTPFTSAVDLVFSYTSATIRTTSTGVTANIFNTNATTVNAFGAGTSIVIGASTGNSTIRNAATNINGNLTVTGATTLQSTLAVGGNTISSAQTTFNLLNTTVTNANILGAADTIVIGSANNSTTIRNAATNINGTFTVTGATTLQSNLAVGGNTISSSQTTFNLLNTTITNANVLGAADTFVIGSANGTATIRNAGTNINGTLTVTGNSTFQSNILANGGTITSSATTFNLLNTTVTNANVLGAANTINFGNASTGQVVNMFNASTSSSTYNIATGATVSGQTKTVNIGTSGITGAVVNINIGSVLSTATSTTTINNKANFNSSINMLSNFSSINSTGSYGYFFQSVPSIYIGNATTNGQVTIGAYASGFESQGTVAFFKDTLASGNQTLAFTSYIGDGDEANVHWYGSGALSIASELYIPINIGAGASVITIGDYIGSYNSTTLVIDDQSQAVSTNGLFKPNGSLALSYDAGSTVRFYEGALNGINYVALSCPASITADVTWTLPASDGSANQVLKTNGSGQLGWATAGGGSAAGSDTQVQFNDGGTSFGGDTGLTYTKTSDTLSIGTTSSPGIINMRGQGEVRFNDADSSNYVSFKSGATVTSNITWTLPTIDGAGGQVLATDGAGTLSWATPPAVELALFNLGII